MSSEQWKECKLGEVISFKNGKKRNNISGTFPIYGGNGILGYSNEYNYSNCLIIGRVGAYCGSVFFEKNNCWISDNAIAGIPYDNFDVKFCFYLLSQLQLNKRCIGTGQPLLTQEILNRIEVKLPPLPTQQKIAAILSSLDDKIELNNRINDNLEQQAQAIFKSWFVDFEPFGGKMPDGWKMGKLSEIAKYSSDKIEVSTLDLCTYYSTENMMPNKGGIVEAASLPSISQTTRCFVGETIVSNIRPYFKKIYYCTEEIAGCSTDVLCFKPIDNKYSEYLYQILYSDKFFDYMVLGSKGTKMPRGDKQQIMSYDIVIPNEEYLDKFKLFSKPILEQINSNRKENKNLTSLRDTLLPKLMNGEIDVEKVEI